MIFKLKYKYRLKKCLGFYDTDFFKVMTSFQHIRDILYLRSLAFLKTIYRMSNFTGLIYWYTEVSLIILAQRIIKNNGPCCILTHTQGYFHQATVFNYFLLLVPLVVPSKCLGNFLIY